MRFSRYILDNSFIVFPTIPPPSAQEAKLLSLTDIQGISVTVCTCPHFQASLKMCTCPALRLLIELSNGDGEIRTLDPLLARQVLSQLSYTPILNKCLFN